MGVVVFVAFKCANPHPREQERRLRSHDWRVVQTALYVKQWMLLKIKKKDPVTKKNRTFNKDLLDMLHVWL